MARGWVAKVPEFQRNLGLTEANAITEQLIHQLPLRLVDHPRAARILRSDNSAHSVEVVGMGNVHVFHNGFPDGLLDVRCIFSVLGSGMEDLYDEMGYLRDERVGNLRGL